MQVDYIKQDIGRSHRLRSGEQWYVSAYLYVEHIVKNE